MGKITCIYDNCLETEKVRIVQIMSSTRPKSFVIDENSLERHTTYQSFLSHDVLCLLLLSQVPVYLKLKKN